MKINYCLPIIKISASEVKKEIEDSKEGYQYFEIWLDYIEDLSIQFIKGLEEQLGERMIFLFRRQNLEAIKMSFEKRKEVMDVLENSESFLDIDVETQKEDLEYIKGKKIKVIPSYHNYKETPSDEFFSTVIENMKEYNPSIYKISTFCKTKEDALRLLRLLLKLKEKGLTSIILGMGEEGIITRIFGTLWGNELTFAPKVKLEESALGQLTRDQLEKILLELQ